jgi:hypothetical protein
VAGDDIPLSPTRGNDVAVLSMIVMGNKNHTAPQALFALFAQARPRSHSHRPIHYFF